MINCIKHIINKKGLQIITCSLTRAPLSSGAYPRFLAKASAWTSKSDYVCATKYFEACNAENL
jgi:hypothetical protein